MARRLRLIGVAGVLIAGLATAQAEETPGFFAGGQTALEGQIPTGTTAAILQMRMAQLNAPKSAAPVSASPFDNVVPSLGNRSGNNSPPAAAAPPVKIAPPVTAFPKPSILDQPGMTLIARLGP